jgi:hypothetical protein
MTETLPGLHGWACPQHQAATETEPIAERNDQ